ncbi:hypothetical protein KQI65_01875 [bacterium]|nr:hypothetical protein [bacterium]
MRIPEAKVSLHLAMWLIDQGLAADVVSVSIDGAMVKVQGKIIFEPIPFLAKRGWIRQAEGNKWSGTYRHQTFSSTIEIHSLPGQGDVVTRLQDGRRFIAECKKGRSHPSRSNPEYSLIREALGQILTIADVDSNDILAIAIPSNLKSVELALRWRRAPLVRKAGIKILTVDAEGNVVGFDA